MAFVDKIGMPKRHAGAGMEPPAKGQDATPKLWIKLLVSAALAFHVAAVFVGPFAFACNSGPAPSPFASAVYGWFRPYLGALYLDHGYFFFAPNPGPSHLVDYKVEFADGRQPVTGRFPDLATERPRLLYHRHFMIAESLNNRFAPPTPPPEPSPPPLTASAGEKEVYRQVRANYDREVGLWRHVRGQYVAMQASLSDHLQHKYGGSRVTLTRVEHRLATPDEVQYAGRRLDAPDSYVNLPETPPVEGR